MMSRKECRERLMSDEQRIATMRRRGRLCPYCGNGRMVEVMNDRLWACCKECDEWDKRPENVVKTELPCVVCGMAIKSSMSDPETPDEITVDNADRLSFDVGAATKISYGYGCELDGNVYMIAICKDCTKQAQDNGRLTYCYNYIP